MLTIEQIRRIAHQTGARDIDKVETDVILTCLLQLFHDKGITEHVAFKGGTMLRKMIFGSRGRLSTDLGFTRRTDISDEGLMESAARIGKTIRDGLTELARRHRQIGDVRGTGLYIGVELVKEPNVLPASTNPTRPLTVNTGVPLAGSHAALSAEIFCPASSNTRETFFWSRAGVSVASIFMG